MAKPKKKVETPVTRPPQGEKQPDDLGSIEATEEILHIIQELNRLEELKKRLLEIEAAHKLKVMEFMGLHQVVKHSHFTLATWRSQTRKTFDTLAFKTEFSELYDSYLKEVNMRVFRLC